jgi:hypothetical protein
MEVVNVKKKFLNKQNYANFEEWNRIDNHVYIGRNMNFYVAGTFASKWQNPYSVKEYGLDKCLKLYEKHVRETSLYDQLGELEGKILGCWCAPEKCHGDILCRLLKEKKRKEKKRKEKKKIIKLS